MRLELFHRIDDRGSAAVRRRLTALRLEGRVTFRNVHFDSHREALEQLGGAQVPAIFDGASLVSGESDCCARLERLAQDSNGIDGGMS